MDRAPATVARGTAPEVALEAALRRLGVEGAERAPSDVAGKPDFFFRHVVPRAVAVFVDGCAWHGCPVHYRPSADQEHGLSVDAVERQRLRDRKLRAALAASGVRVIRFWEHDIKRSADRCARQIHEALA